MIQGFASEPFEPMRSWPRVSTAREACAVIKTSISSIGA
jgi:hypothetical protein